MLHDCESRLHTFETVTRLSFTRLSATFAALESYKINFRIRSSIAITIIQRIKPFFVPDHVRIF